MAPAVSKSVSAQVPVAGGAVGNVLFGGPVGTIGGAAAGALIGNELTKGGYRHRH